LIFGSRFDNIIIDFLIHSRNTTAVGDSKVAWLSDCKRSFKNALPRRFRL